MSCKINGSNVTAIKYGSQNITKVMQNGNTLWELSSSGRFVRLGTPHNTESAYSDDIKVSGNTYTHRKLNYADRAFTSIAYGNNMFIAVKPAQSMFGILNKNSTKWNIDTAYDTLGYSIDNIYNIVFGGNNFYATIKDNSSTQKTFYMYRFDPQLKKWKKLISAAGSSNTYFNIENIAYGNNRFVCNTYGASYIITEAENDTVNITRITGFTGILGKIAFGNGIFITSNDSGYCYYLSDNSTEWNLFDIESFRILSIGYGNGKFIACSSSGDIYKLEYNSSTWTHIGSSSALNWGSAVDIIYGEGRFLISSEMFYSGVIAVDDNDNISTIFLSDNQIKPSAMAYGE